MSNSTDTPKGYAPFDLYPYNPAQPPAFAFLALFGIASVTHFILMFPYRAAFPIPMIIGSGSKQSPAEEAPPHQLTLAPVECVAYWFRSRSHDNLRETLPFLLQNLLMLVAPPFLAATLYMSLSRITRALRAEELSLISLRWVTKLFVLVDAACFVTQTAGAIMSGSENPNEAKQGKNIIIWGLILQIIAFALFILCILVLQIRLKSRPTRHCLAGVLPYRRYLVGLYCTSLLFLVRNIVRIVEYNQGGDGPLLSNEAYLYIFDGCFMLGIVVIIIVLHPGRLVKQAKREGLMKEDVLLESR